MSQYETEVTEGVFPLGGVNDALAQYFSGTSYMNTLVNDPDVPVTVANVSFELGVRNNWHKHNGGFQIILATAGGGLVPGRRSSARQTPCWGCGSRQRRREALARSSGRLMVLPPCYYGRYGRMAGACRRHCIYGNT